MGDSKHIPDSQWLDDQLAEFTDRLLESDAALDTQPTAEDPELRALQEMVIRFRNEFGGERSNETAQARLRATLEAEWHKIDSAGADSRRQSRFPFRWPAWLPTLRTRPAYTLALAATVVIVLVISRLPGTFPSGGLPGTVIGDENWAPAILFLGVLVAGILWWFNRRNSQ